MVTSLRFWRAAFERRFVDQIGQIGSGETRCTAGEDREIHVVAERDLLGVNLQDGFTALHIGTTDDYTPVETAGTEKSGIEHVRTVGGGDEDDAFVGFEAIHLDQQLVEGLLAFIVSAAEACAAMTADRVDFVDEDDAGRVLLALFEQIADAAGAHADEHLDEVGAGDGEERYAGFAGDGAGEQRFAGSRRPDQQHAFGDASAEFLELLRLAQELDDLLQLFLGFFDAGDVFEGDLLLLRGMEAGAALAKAQGFVAAALHLAHHEQPEGDQQDERRNVDQPVDPARAVRFLHVDDHILLPKLVVDWKDSWRESGYGRRRWTCWCIRP